MKNKYVILITLLVSVLGIMIGVAFHIRNLTFEEYFNTNLSIIRSSKGLLIKNKNNGALVGYFDDILPDYNIENTATVIVVKDGLKGYISSSTGEVIFEPQFKYAWVDNGVNNLAACVNYDNKMGFVNIETKETVIPFQYNFDEDKFCPNSDPIFDFVFSNELCLVPGKNGSIGLINEDGEIVLPIEYSDIINWRDNNTQEIILKRMSDHEGKFICGICDRSFNMLVPFEYDEIEKVWEYNYQTHEMQLFGYIVSQNGKYGYLNHLFEIILPVDNDQIYSLDPHEHECMGIIAIKDYVPRLFSTDGKLLNDFYVENQEVFDEESEKYIEKSGLIPLLEPFINVLSNYISYTLNGNYGVIDGSKRVVIPAKYDHIEYLGNGNFCCTIDNIPYLINDQK